MSRTPRPRSGVRPRPPSALVRPLHPQASGGRRSAQYCFFNRRVLIRRPLLGGRGDSRLGVLLLPVAVMSCAGSGRAAWAFAMFPDVAATAPVPADSAYSPAAGEAASCGRPPRWPPPRPALSGRCPVFLPVSGATAGLGPARHRRRPSPYWPPCSLSVNPRAGPRPGRRPDHRIHRQSPPAFLTASGWPRRSARHHRVCCRWGHLSVNGLDHPCRLHSPGPRPPRGNGTGPYHWREERGRDSATQAVPCWSRGGRASLLRLILSPRAASAAARS